MSLKEKKKLQKKIKNLESLENLKKIKSLKSKFLELKEKYKSCKKNNKKYFKKMKLRLIKENTLKYKFSLEKIIISLLPIIDSLEMALKTILNSQNNIPKISEKLLENNIFLLQTLLKNGVTVIEKVNVVFDPSIHQAMFLKKSKKIKKNHVIQVLQKGYLLNNRLLRPAMVSISS
ncbi:nucleotide exchange factor GrpE [Buchnera aphidicola]|uniref:nucleotide exchange factor GrpE n=1 Tax=Buchnera aphidicola TaxID=9 RepID=UPI002093BA11|nr:nucleotide exchange factor GrpE [Buchnera aphidicola]USS94296.1 nucleotide exchange factor GrpE [Buchnera aphidicola (Sipha maydis)]